MFNRLFIINRYECPIFLQTKLIKTFGFNDQKKLFRFYNISEERFSSEFSILNLIKTVRNMKILMNREFLDEKTKIKIENRDDNVIKVDSSE